MTNGDSGGCVQVPKTIRNISWQPDRQTEQKKKKPHTRQNAADTMAGTLVHKQK